METKHTPGPWRVGMRPGPIVYGPQGEEITGMTVAMVPQDEHRANARLIAAAPELAEALADCLADMERLARRSGPGPDKRLAAARAALAKAGL